MRRIFKENWSVFLILLIAIFLRTYNIPQTLLFHFDQGYHGLAIREIWESKRIALLGHKTDVEGVFHGSFFYYFMLPFYLISGWNPAGVSIILAILDSFTVIFIYLLGRDLFNKDVGIIAAVFYAVSYALISYSRWLSNVTPIPFFSTLFFYFLLKAYQEKIRFFPFACLFLGIIAQLNGAIGFFLFLLLVVSLLFLGKKLWTRKSLLLFSLIFFLLPALPLILFDFRHNFLVSRSIASMLLERGGGFSYEQTVTHFNFLGSEFASLLTYKFPAIALILFLMVLIALGHCRLTRQLSWRQVKILLIFLLVPLVGLLFYPGGIHQFFFIGVLPLFVLLLSWGLNYWFNRKLLKPVMTAFIFVIIVVNLYHWQGFLKPGFNLIPIGTRNLITLEDRLMAVDFMHQRALGKPFKTLIYIIPYFQEQPWDYVFSWYGKSKYGYLPNSQAEKTFVIYEPDYDFPYRLESWLGKIEEDHGLVTAKFKIHDLVVEERER